MKKAKLFQLTIIYFHIKNIHRIQKHLNFELSVAAHCENKRMHAEKNTRHTI